MAGFFDPTRGFGSVNTNFMQLGSMNQVELAHKVNELFNNPLRRQAMQQEILSQQVRDVALAKELGLKADELAMRKSMQPILTSLKESEIDKNTALVNQINNAIEVSQAMQPIQDKLLKQELSRTETPTSTSVVDDIRASTTTPQTTRSDGAVTTGQTLLQELSTDTGEDKNIYNNAYKLGQNVTAQYGEATLDNLKKLMGNDMSANIFPMLTALESGNFNPNTPVGKNSTSSASGVFQMTDAFRKDYDKEAEAFKGEFEKAHPKEASSLQAQLGETYGDAFLIKAFMNRNTFNSTKGDTMDFSEIYPYYFLGAKGGRKYLSTVASMNTETKKKTAATTLFPKAVVDANASLFYDKNKKPYSIYRFENVLKSKTTGAMEGVKFATGIKNVEGATSMNTLWGGGDARKKANQFVHGINSGIDRNNLILANPATLNNVEKGFQEAKFKDYVDTEKYVKSVYKDEAQDYRNIMSILTLADIPYETLVNSKILDAPEVRSMLNATNSKDMAKEFNNAKVKLGKNFGNTDILILSSLYSVGKALVDDNTAINSKFKTIRKDDKTYTVLHPDVVEKISNQAANNLYDIFNKTDKSLVESIKQAETVKKIILDGTGDY